MNCLLQKEKTIQRFNYKFIVLILLFIIIYYFIVDNYRNTEEKEKIIKNYFCKKPIEYYLKKI